MFMVLVPLVITVLGLLALSTFALKGKSADEGLRRHEDEEQAQALRRERQRARGRQPTYAETTSGYES